MGTRNVVIAALLPLLAACEGGGGRQVLGEGEPLPASGGVRLEESDSTFVAAATHLTAGPEGTVFVSDARNGVVHQFGRDGRFIRRFGRSGAGPGEFGLPSASAVLDDSLLVVADWNELRVSVFSLRTGAFVTSAPYQGHPFSMSGRDGMVWIGLVNPSRATSLARWQLGTSGVEYIAPVPAEYAASVQLMLTMPYTTATLLGDTILYGVAGHGDLFLAWLDGSILDTIAVPSARRRGVPADIVHRFSREVDDAALAGMVSWLVALHRLSDGRIGVVHQDLTLGDGGVSSVSYLSLLSADRRRGCPDIVLQHAEEIRPLVAFAGDTLLTLETRVGDGDQAEHVLTSYDLVGIECGERPAS